MTAQARVVLGNVDETSWFESLRRRRSADGGTGEARLRLLARDHGERNSAGDCARGGHSESCSQKTSGADMWRPGPLGRAPAMLNMHTSRTIFTQQCQCVSGARPGTQHLSLASVLWGSVHPMVAAERREEHNRSNDNGVSRGSETQLGSGARRYTDLLAPVSPLTPAQVLPCLRVCDSCGYLRARLAIVHVACVGSIHNSADIGCLVCMQHSIFAQVKCQARSS